MNTKSTSDYTLVDVAIDKEINGVLLTISNLHGQIIYQKKVDLVSGINEFTFPILAIEGMYITSLNSKIGMISEKFVVLNR